MKREIPVSVAIAAVAIIVVLVGFFLFSTLRGGHPSSSSSSTPALVARVNKILQRTHGNTNMMSTQEKSLYEEALHRGLIMVPMTPRQPMRGN